MADKLKFQEKLSGILHLAEEKQMHLNIEEIEKFFEEEALSAQQIELVCDYLLSQKVAVSGYEKNRNTWKVILEKYTRWCRVHRRRAGWQPTCPL